MEILTVSRGSPFKLSKERGSHNHANGKYSHVTGQQVMLKVQSREVVHPSKRLRAECHNDQGSEK